MPEPLDEVTRSRMRAQGRRDTKPEIAIRRGLHALGYRFRVDYRPAPDLRCRGDIVFTKRRLVLFVDGCFWHGCPEHATSPKNNAEWWRAKLDANMARDRRADVALEERGWTVLRIWEHVPPCDAISLVVDALT
ncbi:very short patch repair endonuclease [Nocardioides panacis]|uniref:Very short patch repair endonuclease n=1 Tax=Nocardioides panacis TaxID=2849501 RepID=A0A975Y177_9ACTN|nr:very short patch repair endonuclease [Nocardioides panacis]QWZ09233.1 very short patch repair endonuclease [Nocardioides panacis]